ncbi:MAG: methyltransferase domain-containing protein [Pseudomonadota bacterium]|nr:methyltransferase domain-containing protein [Pseudomonadota bacterium]
MSTTNTLNDWFVTPPGKYLLECEQTLFDHSVTDIFGFNALQLGLAEHDFLRASRMPLRAIVGNETGVQVRLDMDELPFGCSSLDLVLLPHVLEFNAHPHQILREVERVLRPEGNVIISGFNPRSLWGARRILGSQTNFPWRGDFIALSRLKDWLALLGFEVVTGRFACYAPPLTNPNWLNCFNFMEPAGDRWWAVWGGIYFLQAIKHARGMNLIKPKWNEGLVGKLLPSAPTLNKEISQCTKTRSE